MKQHQTDQARLSRWVRYLASAFFNIYLLCNVIGWLAPPPMLHGAFGGNGGFELMLQLHGMPWASVIAMPLWQRGLGLALALPALCALGYAVSQLGAMLRSFERAAFFTPQVSLRFRRFVGFLLLGTVLTILEPTLRNAGFSLLGEGRLQLSLDVTGSDLWVLVLCAVFYAIAQIIHEGQRLANENSEFV